MTGHEDGTSSVYGFHHPEPLPDKPGERLFFTRKILPWNCRPYQKNQTEILDALQEKDKAVSLTLQTCAASLQNILEDIYIEARMCAAFPGSFRKGIQLNNLRMLEQIPDLHEQLSRDYQPFTIATNLLLAYCRSGTISNRFHSDSEYLMCWPMVWSISTRRWKHHRSKNG